MDCPEARGWLNAYFDRELDLVTSLPVERHLEECAQCRNVLEGHRLLRQALRGLRYTAPPRQSRRPWLIGLAAAILALLLSLPWLRQRQVEQMAQLHVNALLANRLTEVASSDHHTVKPWFQGKLDFSPPVVEPEDYTLQGARLEQVGSQPAAALVYLHRKHVITLFEWPESGPSSEVQGSWRGYNVVGRKEGEWRYWAVSDLNAEELQQFARRL